jgi:hypothetical protein
LVSRLGCGCSGAWWALQVGIVTVFDDVSVAVVVVVVIVVDSEGRGALEIIGG